jgi:hypothetical protein
MALTFINHFTISGSLLTLDSGKVHIGREKEGKTK